MVGILLLLLVFHGAGNGIQGPGHARQVLYQRATSPIIIPIIITTIIID
jgi:multisubunit Na+/H+ antiporter MnhC subunit